MLVQDNSKPKMLFVVHDYINKAGVEEHVKLLVSNLRSKFHISICFPEANSIVLLQDGCGLIRYPADQIDLIAPYHAEKSEWAFKQILKRVAPDIIHIEHFLNWPLSIIDLAVNSLAPVVVNFHDYYALTPTYILQNGEDSRNLTSSSYALNNFSVDISDYLKRRQNALIQSFRKVSKLITSSKFLAAELSKVFPYEFSVIENGIRPFTKLSSCSHSNELNFGYLGTMQPQKGLTLLISAFNKLHATYPHTNLHIFGGYARHKEAGISSHGSYKRSELPKILSGISVGVVPSLFPEPYSLVLSELWQGGVVPLVADTGAMHYRVTDGVNGKKFICGDENSLFENLCWFVENDTWRNWTLPTPRDVKAMTEEYTAIYAELLHENVLKIAI